MEPQGVPTLQAIKAPANPPTNAILKMHMFSFISLVSEVSAQMLRSVSHPRPIRALARLVQVGQCWGLQGPV
jgi:hypothetical protein